jgi:hypothetical protein
MSAVAYYRVIDSVKSVVAIENVRAAIDQIAPTAQRPSGRTAGDRSK